MGVDEARAQFARLAFAQFLGVEIVAVEPGRAQLRLPFREENANVGGVLHGGAAASLMQMAGALAAWTGIDLQAASCLDTVDLGVQYTAAARCEDVYADACVSQRGRDVFFLDITVRGAAQQCTSKGLMLYRAPQYGTHPVRQYRRPLAPLPAMDTVPPVLRATVSEFTHKLGITTVARAPGSVTLAMPYTPAHCDAQGNLHAGALAALLDTAGTHAAWSLATRAGSRGATVGMQLSYPGVSSEAVMAEAHVQQRSEEMFFSLVQVRVVSTGHLVATGHVTYRLLEAR